MENATSNLKRISNNSMWCISCPLHSTRGNPSSSTWKKTRFSLSLPLEYSLTNIWKTGSQVIYRSEPQIPLFFSLFEWFESSRSGASRKTPPSSPPGPLLATMSIQARYIKGGVSLKAMCVQEREREGPVALSWFLGRGQKWAPKKKAAPEKGATPENWDYFSYLWKEADFCEMFESQGKHKDVFTRVWEHKDSSGLKKIDLRAKLII